MLRRAHLSDDALRLARQRIIVLTLCTWLSLLTLAAVEGRALGGAAIPFVVLDFPRLFALLMPALTDAAYFSV